MKEWERKLLQFAEKTIQKEKMIFGREVQREAVRLVTKKTGKLARSIRLITRKNEISVGSDLPYAIYIEYGTRHRAPHPFLRPALRTVIRRRYKAR